MTETTYHIKVIVPGLVPKYFNVKTEAFNLLKAQSTLEGTFKIALLRTNFIGKKKVSLWKSVQTYIHPGWHHFSEEEEEKAWLKIRKELVKEDLGLSEDGLNREVDAAFREAFGIDRGEREYYNLL